MSYLCHYRGRQPASLAAVCLPSASNGHRSNKPSCGRIAPLYLALGNTNLQKKTSSADTPWTQSSRKTKKKNPQAPHGSCCPALGTFVSMKQMCMSGNTALIVTRTLQHKHSWSSCCCSFLSVCWCSGWTDSQISPVFNTLTSRCLLWTARPLSAPEASTSFSSYSLVPAMFIQYAAEDEGLNKLQ